MQKRIGTLGRVSILLIKIFIFICLYKEKAKQEKSETSLFNLEIWYG